MLEHVDSTSIAASPDTVYDAACALDWLDPEIAVTRISDAGDGVSGSYRLRMHVPGSEHSAVLEVEAGRTAGGSGSAASIARSARSTACTCWSRRGRARA